MKLNKTLTALAVSASFGLSGQAFAAGTPSGEQITNTVKLDYSVSGVGQNQIQDQAQFIVDNKIDMTFNTALSGASTVIPGANIASSYTLVNEGNKAQSFKFELAELDNTFDAPSISALTLDAASDASCSVGGTAPVKTITANPDATCIFTADFVFPTKEGAGLDTDDNIVNGDTFVLRSKVIAVTDPAGATTETTSTENKNDIANLNVNELTVLAEEDLTVVAPHVAYNGEIIVDTGTITVSTANFEGANGLNISVLVVNDPICDATYNEATLAYGKYTTSGSGPVTCDIAGYTPKAIPGALVEYTLTATNEGAVAATNAVFAQAASDITYGSGPATLAIQAGSLGNLASNFSDTGITPAELNDGNNLSVTVSSFGDGETITITFTAIVE